MSMVLRETKGPSGLMQSRREVGRSRCDAQDLTWLLHRTAGVSKLAVSLTEPGGWFCFEGGALILTANLPFQVSCNFLCNVWLKKKEFLKNKPFQHCQVLLTYNLSSSPCTTQELHARMRAVASLKLGLSSQRASGAAQHLQASVEHLYLSSSAAVWLRP